MKYKFISLFSILGLYVVTSGCTSVGSYQSGEILDKSMRGKIMQQSIEYEGVSRNPIIVIHGFLGSKLKNKLTGNDVWGEFSTWDMFFGLDEQKIYDLSCKMSLGTSLSEPDGIVDPYAFLETVKIQLMGFPVYVNAYEDLLSILRKTGYVQYGRPLPPGKHFYSLFPFYYDWRRDLPYNASKLHEYILKQRKYLQNEYEKLYGIKDYDVQFDIVAHSMCNAPFFLDK